MSRPRRSLLAVTVALAVGALALACGSSESEPTATPTPTAATTTEATPSPTATATATATSRPPGVVEDTVALGEELAALALAPALDAFGESAAELTASAFALDIADADGSLWAVVTNGPPPASVDDDGEVVNFFHFVAIYRRGLDGTWSEELGRVTLESAPARIHAIELIDAGTSATGRAALIALLGGTGAHAGTLDVVLVEGGAPQTVLSHISASPDAGTIADLDGDGRAEIVLNTSDPYVFCYACAVEVKAERIHRWVDGAWEAVQIAVPRGVSGELAAIADDVVRLAEADLWREAATLATATSRAAPGHEGLRWLSIAVNRTAALRLAHAGTPGQPLLTNVIAGEYEAAYALMRALPVADVFTLDGPLIAGTAAESDLATMAVTLRDFSGRALKVRRDDHAIHAVRALGFAIASPDNPRRPFSALPTLSPDPFVQMARAFFVSSMQRIRAEGAPRDPHAYRCEPEQTAASSGRAEQLAAIVQDADTPALVLALGISDDNGSYWVAAPNKANFISIYRLANDGTWSAELGRVRLLSAGAEVRDLVLFAPCQVRENGASVLFTSRVFTAARTGILEMLLFENGRLQTVYPEIRSVAFSGEDIDGDGRPEITYDSSNPDRFKFTNVVVRTEEIYRWSGRGCHGVVLAVPAGLDGEVAELANEVVRLVKADLWRAADELATRALSEEPAHEGLWWLAKAVERTAERRLALAGDEDQPIVTNVIAGEYEAAYALMRALPVEEVFTLDSPLLEDVATDLLKPSAAYSYYFDEMLDLLLDFTGRANEVRPDDAAIHAVRAWALALEAPGDLSEARDALAEALRLAPDDPFLQSASDFLASVGQLP